MKIVLACLNAKYIHSSLACYYLRACSQEEFPGVEVMEFTINEDPGDIMAEIYRKQPDVAAFSCYIWNIELTLTIARNLKQLRPEMVVILGGPEVSFDPVPLMEQNPAIDYVVRGEGETTFPELLRVLSQGQIGQVKGTTCRVGAKIIHHEDRELIQDLDTIPFAYKDVGNLDHRILYYETSRGCPFNCSYCLSSTVRGVRYFPPERVKKELQFLVKAGAGTIKFVDRTFNANPDRARELMQFLMELEGDTVFHFEIVADLLSDDMLAFLSQAPPGRFQFEIGVQSTNKSTLQAINRRLNWPRLERAVKTIGKYGSIHQHLDLIAGLPGENYDSLGRSFNMVYGLRPDYLQLGFLKMLKGSRIREQAEQFGYLFTAEPPYEVLENEFISYEEMLRVKRIEDLLQQYYNSGDFHHTLHYLTDCVYHQRPFDFYEQLAIFWEERELHRVRHRKRVLYSLLRQFVAEKQPDSLQPVNELLKLDYLLNYRSYELPEGLERVVLPEQKEAWETWLQREENQRRYFPELHGIALGRLKRQLHLELFTDDMLFLIGIRQERENRHYYPALFQYPPGRQKALRWQIIGSEDSSDILSSV